MTTQVVEWLQGEHIQKSAGMLNKQINTDRGLDNDGMQTTQVVEWFPGQHVQWPVGILCFAQIDAVNLDFDWLDCSRRKHQHPTHTQSG